MTFWAKLLTVIVFVLSLAFAAMSGVIFAKRADYRGQLVKEQMDRKSDVDRLTGENQKLTGDRDQLRSELGKKTTDLESAKLQLDSVTQQKEQFERDVAQKNSELAAAHDNISKLTLTADALMKRNEGLTQENDSIRGENMKLSADLSTERTRSSELEKSNGELRGQNDELGKELASANDTIELNEEVFAELERRNIEARDVILGFQTFPSVDGKVVTVGGSIVILSVGSKDEVRKNFEFTIYRGSQYVAKVNVFDVQETQCAARVVSQKVAIRPGDDAATRLQ